MLGDARSLTAVSDSTAVPPVVQADIAIAAIARAAIAKTVTMVTLPTTENLVIVVTISSIIYRDIPSCNLPPGQSYLQYETVYIDPPVQHIEHANPVML